MIRYRDVDALRVLNFCKLFVQSGEAVAVEIVHTCKKDPLVETIRQRKLTCAGRPFGGDHNSTRLDSTRLF